MSKPRYLVVLSTWQIHFTCGAWMILSVGQDEYWFCFEFILKVCLNSHFLRVRFSYLLAVGCVWCWENQSLCASRDQDLWVVQREQEGVDWCKFMHFLFWGWRCACWSIRYFSSQPRKPLTSCCTTCIFADSVVWQLKPTHRKTRPIERSVVQPLLHQFKEAPVPFCPAFLVQLKVLDKLKARLFALT